MTKYDHCFVIGMAKTGTSSVKVFLKSHGSKHLTINRWVTKEYYDKNYSYISRLVKNYNSFDDRPWNQKDIIEKIMNSEYNVAMILTQRDPTERFYSMIRYAKKRNRIPQKESEIQNSVDKYYDHQKFCRDLAKKK